MELLINSNGTDIDGNHLELVPLFQQAHPDGYVDDWAHRTLPQLVCGRRTYAIGFDTIKRCLTARIEQGSSVETPSPDLVAAEAFASG